MRTLSILQLVVFLSVSSAVTAFAGPVTGQAVPQPASDESSGDDNDDSEDAAAFAPALLFDGIGLPLLRLSAPVYLQLGSRGKLRGSGGGIQEEFPSGGDMGNVSVSPGLNLTDGLVIPGPWGPALQNPTFVPEPTALLLMLPAVALLQRRIRARFTRS